MKTAKELPNIKQMKIIKDDDKIGISNVPMSFQKLEDCESKFSPQNMKPDPNQFKKAKQRPSIEVEQVGKNMETKDGKSRLEKATSQNVRDLLTLQQQIAEKGVKEVLKNTKKIS